jgi:hypothetical protein
MEGIASIVPLILVFLIMYFLLIRPAAAQAQGASGHGRGAPPRATRSSPPAASSAASPASRTGENEVEVEIAPQRQRPRRPQHHPDRVSSKTEPGESLT